MTSTKWGALRQQAEDATKALPKGVYTVEVTKAEAVKASTGADMIKATLAVVDGPHKGRTIWTNFVLSTEKAFAMNMFFKNMAGFGLNGQFFDTLEQQGAGIEADMHTVANTLIGRRATGDVDVRTYQGQERNEINNFRPADSSGPLGVTNAPAVPVAGGAPAGGPPPVPSVPSTPQVGTTPQVGNGPSAPPDIVF